MSELTEFLLARLAEDEAVAQGASLSSGGRDWSFTDGDEWNLEDVRHSVVRGSPPDPSEVAFTFDEEAAHIARHDPARVLATVKAHRVIVELHAASMTKQWMNPPDGPAYQEEEWSCEICGWFEAGSACDTLRALARIYADAPGFREE
jgi:hypothetical protein